MSEPALSGGSFLPDFACCGSRRVSEKSVVFSAILAILDFFPTAQQARF
jgi:hypothetical protein